MSRNILDKVLEFNWGRDPERLLLKYRKMRSSSYSFYRATCHLFYEDWAAKAPTIDPAASAPMIWISGDLHLENFGSFKGDDRQVYFGMNDFDEAILAPCTWELVRFLGSVFVAVHTLGIDHAEARHLGDRYLKAYTEALESGKSRTVHSVTAEGMIKDLLKELDQRKRKDFLDRYTRLKKDKRQIVIDPKRFVTIPAERRSQIESFMSKWAETQENPAFFQVLDVAGRLSGTASMGLMRYLLLVEGQESPDRNYLLDLKQTHPSCLQPHLQTAQPTWENEAVRVETIQRQAQAVPPALLHAVTLEGEPFLLRELQPTQDKLSLSGWNGKLERLETVVETMGQITAWSQLRSSGRRGSATADDLVAFAENPAWHDLLLDYAESYVTQVEADYQDFCADYEKMVAR
ncbi:DUF2252 domain-containing protein [filamentous cyanobacterium CCP2]|nr:DUF2252 domain-containing protein [filamentous cyanobacterium CCP2]